MAERLPFGKALRDKHFLYKDGYTPLNHGSFGTFPLAIRDEMTRLLDECEGDVDGYIRYIYPIELEKSRQTTADLLNVDSSTIVFVPNATTAINVVLRSIVWEPKDVIIYFDIAYSGFEKTVEYMIESTPVSAQVVDTKWPCEDDELVAAFEKTVQDVRATGKNPRLTIFETISSMPGVRLPFEELTRKSKELGVLSFVDGAQGIGQIEIDLSTFKPDFFTSNLHKWLFVPRGCAVLYIPEGNQSLIRSSVPTSHGYKIPPRTGQRTINNPFPPVSGSAFHELFGFVGTTNNDAYLTVSIAMEFRKTVCGGEKAIIDYTINLAKVGGDKAAQILGTEVFDNKSGTLRQCAFANVRLPLEHGDGPGQIPVKDMGKVQQFIAEESVKAGTFFAFVFYEGTHWWRISATVMLEESDIIWGAQLMKSLCERATKGEYINSKSH